MRANGYDKSSSVNVGVQTDFCELKSEIEAEKDEFKEMVCKIIFENYIYNKFYILFY